MRSAEARGGVYAVGLILLVSGVAQAQPAISGVSGTFDHKATVTITGTNFGSKPQAAPLVWDDASGSSLEAKWSGAWPDSSDSSSFYMRYTTPMRGVPLPHSHVSKYIAGGHGNVGWTLSVAMYKNYTVTSYPQPVYISYYYRVDDAWNFCAGDNNFKLGSHSMPNGPYNEPYWYYEHRNPDFSGSGASPGIYTPYIPSSAGGSFSFLNSAANPIGKWVKMELEILYTNQSNGYIKIWNDGVLSSQYNGPTDAGGPGQRADAIGGYARCYGITTNWRYFADAYFDTSRARVILGNAPTLAASTRREVQIPTAWSSSSVSVSVNLGGFSNGQTAYLYVVAPDGSVNSAGRALTVGGGSTTTPPPASPMNIRIIR